MTMENYIEDRLNEGGQLLDEIVSERLQLAQSNPAATIEEITEYAVQLHNWRIAKLDELASRLWGAAGRLN